MRGRSDATVCRDETRAATMPSPNANSTAAMLETKPKNNDVEPESELRTMLQMKPKIAEMPR